MSGKGDKPRKFNKELNERYLNNKFWDSVKPKEPQK